MDDLKALRRFLHPQNKVILVAALVILGIARLWIDK
jgi:hypothetical protein